MPSRKKRSGILWQSDRVPGLRRIIRRLAVKCGCLIVAGMALSNASFAASFRPPAVPLVTNNPYFSIWSFANHLTYDSTRHWTGTKQELHSLIRVDGVNWRIMGAEPRKIQPMPQTNLTVTPTRTTYQFEGGGVQVTLVFLTPMFPHNIDMMSWPVTYLIWRIHSVDGRQHKVSIYYDNTAQLVVNTEDEAVVWSNETVNGLETLRMGTQSQPVLQKSGDNLRIDWGYLYAAAPAGNLTRSVVANLPAAFREFEGDGSLPPFDHQMPQTPDVHMPAMAFVFDCGMVGPTPVEHHLILAYDQLDSIEYFHQKLRPYWRLHRNSAQQLLVDAEERYPSIVRDSETFDHELMTDLAKIGGEHYSLLASLAYRQALAAQIIVAGPDGKPFMLPKENFSNGCIGTVDVIYPGSPILLLFNPKLVEASLLPVLEYAESSRWSFPFAPHDLGTYPLANGQVYGRRAHAGNRQMPVEETGNMLLMVAALSSIEGNARFAAEHWPVLTKWADYLKQNGLDPGNQLSTDDFAGFLAHSANLSAKAIEALAAYGELARMLHHDQTAAEYHSAAEDFARRWQSMANDGDHYRLAFDKPGTWSQKYNLVWDDILGFHLFPPEVSEKEVRYYEEKENRFGFPLDNRAAYTKLDWEIWSATLARSTEAWNRLIAPVWTWVNESSSRVPLTDWYWTTDGTQVGFQARSVVGGIFIKMLSNRAVWRRWAIGPPLPTAAARGR